MNIVVAASQYVDSASIIFSTLFCITTGDDCLQQAAQQFMAEQFLLLGLDVDVFPIELEKIKSHKAFSPVSIPAAVNCHH